MTDAVNTDLSANPIPKKKYPNYHQQKYHRDPEYADQFKAYNRRRYHEMPAADRAALISSKMERYKTDPAVRERQRKSNLAYYYKKKGC